LGPRRLHGLLGLGSHVLHSVLDLGPRGLHSLCVTLRESPVAWASYERDL